MITLTYSPSYGSVFRIHIRTDFALLDQDPNWLYGSGSTSHENAVKINAFYTFYNADPDENWQKQTLFTLPTMQIRIHEQWHGQK